MLTIPWGDLGTTWALGFVLSLFFHPLVRRLAFRWNLVDHPDGRRKLHGRPVPLAGGLSVFLATWVSLILVVFLGRSLGLGHSLNGANDLLGALLAGSLILLSVGLVDDLGSLRRSHKLLGQLLASAVVVGWGVRLERVHLFGWELDLGVLSVPITLFWLLGTINALNLLDGMDGLLGMIGLLACVGIAILAGLHSAWAVATLAVAMAGAILGFLSFNLPPARIFMGDSGSLCVGLILGVLSLESSRDATGMVALAAPAALLLLPALDTLAAILRRKLTGRSLFATDRGHLHHCLQRQGLSPPQVLALVVALTLVASAGAVASHIWNHDILALLSASVVVVFLVGSRSFGHAEFLLLKGWIVANARDLVARPDQARQRTIHIEGKTPLPEIWARLTAYAQEYRLQRLSLDIYAPVLREWYHGSWVGPSSGDALSEEIAHTVIPLLAAGHLVGRLEIRMRRATPDFSARIAAMMRLADQVEVALAGLPTLRPHPVPKPHARKGHAAMATVPSGSVAP